ncbi:plasmid replication protein, CyRepA1 family (plasmid) [Nostoc sp. UHCC 0302]|uniref:plasmid replication protein, CyRepA1 family n=1 Tax=Nostoc sp. UHCC 0302 TaxID=3134896 RepID=UPI00311CB81B
MKNSNCELQQIEVTQRYEIISRPSRIEAHHWNEWLASAVDPGIIALNVISVSGTASYDYLFYGQNVPRRNDGRLRDGVLNKYRHIERLNWWCSGVDPLNEENPMQWGCMKPDHPRRDQNKVFKFIKYEHPLRVPTRAFFLAVPDYTWESVAARYDFPISDEDRAYGFWHWVWKYNIPVVICEGAKKAGALLTLGYAAIAIPGVNSGYRNPKDGFGQPTGEKHLIPELQHFATLGRKFIICFDHDTKPETVQRVNIAIAQTAKLLGACGCQALVTQWSYPEKGIDDLIAARGPAVADEIISLALSLDQWQVKEYSRLSYEAALVLNQRYLGELPIPSAAKLILLKSFKGSGKTQSFAPIVQEAIANGQPVILLSHRVQLAQAIAERVGIPYISQVRNSETGVLLGFALCVDSLHPHGQARFNALHWKEPLVIIDESEQVIWHLLSANTEVKKHRVEVLNQLSQLFKNAFAPGRGRVIVADADLSDLSPEMVMGLAETQVTPWVVVNNWKGQPWNIYHYKQTTPVNWLAALEDHIKTGGKPFIAVDCQKAKSKWGTKVLEARLKKQFPDRKILRIDSETIADPEHEAYGCIERLNRVLLEYDIVLASPSIGTGVSIDIRGHFTSVWGCFQGVAPENATRQALARVREAIPRYLWVARHGLGKIGNGAISFKSLLACEQKRFQANLRLLQDASLIINSDEININRTALNIFIKMSCRINAGMIHYRDTVLEELGAEGHNIIDVLHKKTHNKLNNEITAQRNEVYDGECHSISTADTTVMTAAKYEALQQQRAKTTTERYIERKYKLEQRYGVDVTPELIKKDDQGYYPQLRLCYYLTIGREFVAKRDRKLGEKMLASKSAWLPDFNGGQLGLVVHALELFNIPNFIADDREFRGTDGDLVQMANNALSVKWQVKTVLDITLNDNDSPIVILRRLLKKIGLKLKYIYRDGTGERQRVYRVVGADDGRDEILHYWLAKEKA